MNQFSSVQSISRVQFFATPWISACQTAFPVYHQLLELSDFTFTFHFHALEKKMATHSSILAWRIPGTEEHSGLPSMGSYRVEHDWSDLAAAAAVPMKYCNVSSSQIKRFETKVTCCPINHPSSPNSFFVHYIPNFLLLYLKMSWLFAFCCYDMQSVCLFFL